MSILLRDQKPQYTRYGLKVFQRKSARIIVFCPRLEEWVLQAAWEVGLRAGDFGLPEDGSGLHRVVNERLEKFKKFVGEVWGKQSPHFQELKALMEETGTPER